MENNTSRILIETIVRKAIRNIKEEPGRSTRNLVDMALHFSNNRFQQHFFETAQTMLKNEKSPYYDLIRNIVMYTDSERLFHFGMNLGYNACTAGAAKIRETEEKELFDIPWVISLYIQPDIFQKNSRHYENLITDGESLGIHAWMLFCDSGSQAVLPLAELHPDSAFALFCKRQDITPSFLEQVSEIHNLMLVLSYEEDSSALCRQLRDKELLYSIYTSYSQENMESVTSGNLFYSMEQLHPAFAILLPESGCPDSVRKKIYQYVKTARTQQIFQFILWDAIEDSIAVDNIISDNSCLAVFDTDGQLITLPEKKPCARLNLLQTNLKDILKFAFPKYTEDIFQKKG